MTGCDDFITHIMSTPYSILNGKISANDRGLYEFIYRLVAVSIRSSINSTLRSYLLLRTTPTSATGTSSRSPMQLVESFVFHNFFSP